MKRLSVFLSLLIFSVATLAQSTPASAPAKQTAPIVKSAALKSKAVAHKKPSRATKEQAASTTTHEIDALKATMAEERKQQQDQIDSIRKSNADLIQQLHKTQSELGQALNKIDHLDSDKAGKAKVEADLSDVKKDVITTQAVVEEQKKKLSAVEHPTTIHYKGVTIAPGGFFAAEALYRRNAENADINTSWNSIPWSHASAGHITEFRASARQTRLSLRADGNVGNAKLTGYFEADFLGSGYGANENQSNGYSDRIRQMWGRVAFGNGWVFSGGQMWSLLNTNRKGIDNLAEWTTMTPDATQFLGHDYARQAAFRIVKNFDNPKLAVAFAAENAATVSVVPANVPSAVSSVLAGLSTTGTTALSNTTYSTNLAPDLIAKVAYDPHFGHYEVKFIGRFMRDRLISTPTSAGKSNTTVAGGIGGAVRLPIYKKVDWTAEGMWGNVGRYGATSTDAIIKPDGSISPEKTIHFLTAIETRLTPKLDWYALGSGEYLYRNHGYGLPTIDNTKCFNPESTFSCSANVKSLVGGSMGIWYSLFRGPYGNVRYGLNYTYVEKTSWSGVGGAPKAYERQFETSFRYYLP